MSMSTSADAHIAAENCRVIPDNKSSSAVPAGKEPLDNSNLRRVTFDLFLLLQQ